MNSCVFVVIFFFMLPDTFAQSHVKPFVTDECTLFREGTHTDPELWADCCVLHDLLLWAGGTRVDRNNADRALYNCVLSKNQPEVARLMYWGVRLGHLFPVKFKNQAWSNAWIPARGKEPLTLAEMDLLEQALQHADISSSVKAEFLSILHHRGNELFQ